MNDKFFDLKKEKQDRMINAALKIFALYGYKHASTDDIVAAAGISKGLLFHYFGSKLGVYSFIHDYSVRFMKLEISGTVSSSVHDYFEIRRQIEFAKMQVLKNYPYMQLFLIRTQREDMSEALVAIGKQRDTIPELCCALVSRSDLSLFRKSIDLCKLDNIVVYTMDGLMETRFQDASYQPEMFYEEALTYLTLLKEAYY